MKVKFVLELSKDNNNEKPIVLTALANGNNEQRISGVINISTRMRPGQFFAEIRKSSSAVTITAEDDDYITRAYRGSTAKDRFKKYFKAASNVKVTECYITHEPDNDESGNFYFEVANHGWPGDPD